MAFDDMEKLEYYEKNLSEQTQLTLGVEAGIWTRAKLVGGERLSSLRYPSVLPNCTEIRALCTIHETEFRIDLMHMMHVYIRRAQFTSKTRFQIVMLMV